MEIDIKRLAVDREYWDECGAPEDAEFYAPAESNLVPAFYRIDKESGVKYCHLGRGDRWDESAAGRDLSRAIPRPPKKAQEAEWNGEGLPPVGCECEYRPDPTMRPSWWEPCIYLAHYDDEHFVIMKENSGVDRMPDSPPADVRFRPIRTQAERDRGEWIDKASIAAGFPECQATRKVCADIYDGLICKQEGS